MALQYENPIIPGFAADPSICRHGEYFYLATSSFEWLPAIPVYRSKDLVNWELYTHIITDEKTLDLRYVESAKGIWAPCLTYNEDQGLFYITYNVMHSMNARFFDVDNYIQTASSIEGPWSEPIYMHSAGFDGSMFHDDDGRQWMVSLEWETRDGWHKPGVICLCEYNSKEKCIVDLPKRIFGGATKRGCIEAPHLYKRDGYYYLMCAEGGTGYGHCVTLARAKDIHGPYEPDPMGPIMTCTDDFDEMDSDESRKLHRYNPDSYLQKSGHGSIVETEQGEVYLFYLCGRPMLPELRCVLGRECSMQKMEWTADGWLRKAGGKDNRAQKEITLPNLPIGEKIPRSVNYRFDGDVLTKDWNTPRIQPTTFAHVENGKVVLRGEGSISSTANASLLARRLTGLNDSFEATLSVDPKTYQQYAGICIYYDQMDYLLLRKVWHEETGACALELLKVENGERVEYPAARVTAPEGEVRLRLSVDKNDLRFYWKTPEQETFTQIGGVYPTDHYSDEFCKAGEFTGTFVGLFCVDALVKRTLATFDDIRYIADET